MSPKHCVFLIGIVFAALALSGAAQGQTTFQGSAVIVGAEQLLTTPRGVSIWGTGVVEITANGSTVYALYGQGSTASSMASSLCASMNSSFPVHCIGTTAKSNTSVILNFQASANYQISTSCRITEPVGNPGCLFEATVTGFFNPGYYILSVLYSPPGNHSSNGYANTTSTGTTASIGSNFSQGSTTSYSAGGGLFGTGSLGVSFGVSASTGNSTSFEVTYQNGTGAQLESTRQNIDHTQDQLFLWLNPQITINSVLTGSSNGSGLTTSMTNATYSIGTINNQPMDIVNVDVAGLQNPSQIPLSILLPQTIQPGVVLPGLASICAHPLPPAQCTQANACGCVTSDFTRILAADALIGVSQTVAPSQIDSKRFVFVNSEILEGPQQVGGGPVINSFTASDSSLVSQTETEMQTTSSGYSTSSGIDIPFLFTLTITDTSSFSFTNTESQGVQNGKAHQASVSLGSSNVGCFEHVDIYEDTAYHTFAFALPAAPPTNCQ